MVEAGLKPTPALGTFYVYVTDRCNCACKHCWIIPSTQVADGRTDHFISPDVLDAAICEAKPLGLTSIKWTGGEPTIHPQFVRLLEIQKQHGIDGSMETNGLLLTPELVKQLVDSSVSFISVSIDGARPETHDAIRGVKGAHRRALNGVRVLVEAGYKPQFIMSLMRENVAELEDLLQLAQDSGAGSVKFNVVQPTLRGEDMHTAGQALSISELLHINTRIQQDLQKRYTLAIYMDVPLAFRPLTSMFEEKGLSRCGIKTILGLLADGHYALCGIGEHVPEMVFGAAGQGQLETIWTSHPVLQQIRDGLPAHLKGICAECLMRSACLGACVAQNYYRTKDLLGAFWFCEEAAAQGLFPSTRRRI